MAEYQGIKFSASDVVEPENWIAKDEYNPHGVRAWLLHDHGFCVCVAFGNEQDALDSAVDAGKMDRYLIGDAERGDYTEDDDRISYLGNACEQFDIETLGMIELPNVPRLGFADAFAAAFPNQ